MINTSLYNIQLIQLHMILHRVSKLTIHFLFLILIFSSCEPDHSINVNQTVIIIKADDLGDMTPKWEQFISKSMENNVPVSIGIISKNMTSAATKSKAKELAQSHNNVGQLSIQFWNHGYDHLRTNNVEEFKTPDLVYQSEHIKLSQDFFKDTLDINCDTFSTPFNESSDITFEALKSFPEIKVWMCYQLHEKQFHTSWVNPNWNIIGVGQNQILLDIKCESVLHVPSKSVKMILEKNKHLPYLIIQIHPNTWNDQEFQDYQALLDYLKEKKMIFMTPQEYYRFLKE